MLFSGINIRKELIRQRSVQTELLDEVNELLSAAAERDSDILTRLKKKTIGSIKLDQEDTENVFSLEDIKRICVKFRLRFLESGYFKAEYPFGALTDIKNFENKYDVKIESFRIIAPAEAFDLENINKDPLLFAQLNENTFYLLHQWGHDLKWYRKILAWPLQNLKTLMLTIAMICFAFAFSLPSSAINVINLQSEIYLRIWLTVHTFIGLLGLTLWAGLAFDKTFSSLNWDSKYYNY